MGAIVKEEIPELGPPTHRAGIPATAAAVIDVSSSDSDSEVEECRGAKRSGVGGGGGGGADEERRRTKKVRGEALPLGFLDPIPLDCPLLPLPPPQSAVAPVSQGFKQFWKAGDYVGSAGADSLQPTAAGMDHVRVHPKFLHSNATSHKWALGALAELLDNSLDEVCNGATYVNIDMLENKKDGARMLLVEDDGGGMDPEKMRQCMSLGYSAKCKIASTIGQYGNGFKTSTMRLGADVIMFSRSRGKDGRRPTQSIGMLSYTFLRSTGMEDIVVPMLDYQKEQAWKIMRRTSLSDWNTNLETIMRWSPYSSESDLLQQFNSIKDQGTRIVIYNLWEDEQGELELDFDADKHDIQIRGSNRDERNIQMAKQFPNSRHFLTYRHSLRSYASILYLRLPHVFRMILRGKEIDHHNIVNDMMLKQQVTYRPQSADGLLKDPNMVAVVTVGFVKDAKHHIDVQGFNVYHKNRLIKPFWRVWTAAGSGGRGVIGVLEANFIEPAHDKQDFERTTILSRLEARLVQMQKQYWSTNSHRIGYAPIRNRNESEAKDSSPEATLQPSRLSGKDITPNSGPIIGKTKTLAELSSGSNHKNGKSSMPSFKSSKLGTQSSGRLPSSGVSNVHRAEKNERSLRFSRSRLEGLSHSSDESEPEYVCSLRGRSNSHGLKISPKKSLQKGSTCIPLSPDGSSDENHAANESGGMTTKPHLKESKLTSNEDGVNNEDSESTIKQLKDKNIALNQRIVEMEESMPQELQRERDRNKSLTEQLEEARRKLEEAKKEQEALIDIFSEERIRRDGEAENLRKKLKIKQDVGRNLIVTDEQWRREKLHREFLRNQSRFS